MKNIKYLSLSILTLGMILFNSCLKIDTYLDKAESGGMTPDEVFGDYTLAEKFLANIYAALPQEYAVDYSCATDDAKSPHGTAPENEIINGQFSPSGNSYNVWTPLYRAIRKVNIFLERANEIPVTTATQIEGKPRMIGEAHFLRAFFYEELFKRWGGVPLLKRALDVNENMDIPRSSAEETVDFIVDECDTAASLLPLTYKRDNLGRATKGAAMALKARVLLYAASPLHNPSNEKSKWKSAADAAKAVMDLQIYSLDPDYSNLFHTRNSPEIIFQSTKNYTDYTKLMFVPSQGGWGGVAPLQNLVDQYEMTNGEKPILSYQADGTPVINPVSGYDPDDPYVDRDPRFYMSILYNGAKWRGEDVYTYLGAPGDGINGGFNNTLTGYYMIKTVDENSSRTPVVKNGSYFWIYMRYAEVLLNYAEAQNEYLNGPDQSVYNAIDSIRSRPGVNMPDLPTGLTKDEMRDRIHHERRIELAFEGQRFFDIKRWEIGEKVMPKAYGVMITKEGSTYKHERFLLETRVYRKAFNLYPIMQTEINRDPKIIQNPGYN